jgi:23S rRNA pseudouridine1911/1915/1917 synthase
LPFLLSCYNPSVPTLEPSPRRDLLAASSDAGTRLDRFVTAKCPDLSRARVQELIDVGLIEIEGKTAKASRKVRTGEHISVDVQPRPPLRAEPEYIPLDVLYEDDDLVVVNKPAGMAVHAGAGNSRGTLVNALLGRGQPLSEAGGVLRPGIVHRLDKNTSGAIVIAKNDFAHARLAEAFRKREVKKTYLALVQGKLRGQHGRIDFAIARDAHRRVRMTARHVATAGKVREARTDWRALTTIDNTTLLEVQIHTGRTHQIRAHFAALQHPVVGDTLYGAAAQLRVGRVALPKLGRQFLHATRLAFAHPRSGKWIEMRAPLCTDLRGFLGKLLEASGQPSSAIDAVLAQFL